MAVKLQPPEAQDVKRVSIGARTYEPKGGSWTIDDIDADDLRRAGWQDVPSADKASTVAVETPTQEPSDANS